MMPTAPIDFLQNEGALLDTIRKLLFAPRRSFTFFIGSGLSLAAGFPAWGQIWTDICARALRPPAQEMNSETYKKLLKQKENLRAFEEELSLLKKKAPKTFKTYYKEKFGNKPSMPPGGAYSYLAMACRDIRDAGYPVAVVTTNYDLSVHHAMQVIGGQQVTTLGELIDAKDKEKIPYIYLHRPGTPGGEDWDDPEKWVISKEDYEKFYKNSDRTISLRNLVENSTMIFLGYGGRDRFVNDVVASALGENTINGNSNKFLFVTHRSEWERVKECEDFLYNKVNEENNIANEEDYMVPVLLEDWSGLATFVDMFASAAKLSNAKRGSDLQKAVLLPDVKCRVIRSENYVAPAGSTGNTVGLEETTWLEDVPLRYALLATHYDARNGDNKKVLAFLTGSWGTGKSAATEWLKCFLNKQQAQNVRRIDASEGKVNLGQPGKIQENLIIIDAVDEQCAQPNFTLREAWRQFVDWSRTIKGAQAPCFLMIAGRPTYVDWLAKGAQHKFVVENIDNKSLKLFSTFSFQVIRSAHYNYSDMLATLAARLAISENNIDRYLIKELNFSKKEEDNIVAMEQIAQILRNPWLASMPGNDNQNQGGNIDPVHLIRYYGLGRRLNEYINKMKNIKHFPYKYEECNTGKIIAGKLIKYSNNKMEQQELEREIVRSAQPTSTALTLNAFSAILLSEILEMNINQKGLDRLSDLSKAWMDPNESPIISVNGAANNQYLVRGEDGGTIFGLLGLILKSVLTQAKLLNREDPEGIKQVDEYLTAYWLNLHGDSVRIRHQQSRPREDYTGISLYHLQTDPNFNPAMDDMSGTALGRARLHNWEFTECLMEAIGGAQSDLRLCRINKCFGPGITFAEAILSGVQFTGGSFKNAVFSMADLSNSFFEDCDLESASFFLANAHNASFIGSEGCFLNLRNILATGARFVGATFKNCDFWGALFLGTDLRFARFENCRFENVIFSRCLVNGTSFINCEFPYANIADVDFSGIRSVSNTKAEKATIQSCTFLGDHWRDRFKHFASDALLYDIVDPDGDYINCNEPRA